eukprot:2667762-Prymnesium_polylepis.1
MPGRLGAAVPAAPRGVGLCALLAPHAAALGAAAGAGLCAAVGAERGDVRSTLRRRRLAHRA